jgi:hypothetical protein
MRIALVLLVAVVMALLGFGVGNAAGNRTGYAAGSRDGYLQGEHSVCLRLATDEQQLSAALTNAQKSNPGLAQTTLLIDSIVSHMHSDACSQ